MNPYVFPAVCDVCGGEGVTTAKDGAGWLPTHHRDPSICRDNIRRQRERMQRELTELSDRLRGLVP